VIVWRVLQQTWYREHTSLVGWLTRFVGQDQADEIARRVIADVLISAVRGTEMPRGVTFDLYSRAVHELGARDPRLTRKVGVLWRRTIPLPTGPRYVRLCQSYAVIRAVAVMHHASPWESQTVVNWLLHTSPPERGFPRLPEDRQGTYAIEALWSVLRPLVGDQYPWDLLRAPGCHSLYYETLLSEHNWIGNQRDARKETPGGNHKQAHYPSDPIQQETARTDRFHR